MSPLHSPGTGAHDNQQFFGERAATWDDKFPDDAPLYGQAVAEFAPALDGVVVDVGCGTGRALPFLRSAVGARGVVIGLDLTIEMLREARARNRVGAPGGLLRADARFLPFADRSCDAIFAAGLLHHLPDPVAGLREFARIARPGARLALFHPIGRAALAHRHGHDPDPDDVRGEARIAEAFEVTGWQADQIDDAPNRYLTTAVRRDAD